MVRVPAILCIFLIANLRPEIRLEALALEAPIILPFHNAVDYVHPLCRSGCSSRLFVDLLFILSSVSIYDSYIYRSTCIPLKIFAGMLVCLDQL